MKNKVGPPFKDPELVKSKCGYMLPKWLKDLIREQDEPAGVLIERVIKDRIVMQCQKCGYLMQVESHEKAKFNFPCAMGCGKNISSFKKVII